MAIVPEPSLSVVIVTRDTYQTLRPVIGALRRQTIVDRIELVIVAPRGAGVVAPSADTGAFHSVRVVEVDSVLNRGKAAAHGVLGSTAPIVALSENHCFPEERWAERTLAAHDGSWAGVGPAIGNANPDTLVSHAMHAFGYGQFPRSGAAELRDALPLHNSSYRRECLPSDAGMLEPLLADERRLQSWMVERGYQLRFDPAPVKWHINEATWRLYAGASYENGRRYGGSRIRGWTWLRRLSYAAAVPLLSLPVARSIWRKLPASGSPGRGPLIAAVVWVGGLLHAVGEGVSYLLGPTEEFRFVEEDEFMIRERLGGQALSRRETAELVDLLDGAPIAPGRP